MAKGNVAECEGCRMRRVPNAKVGEVSTEETTEVVKRMIWSANVDMVENSCKIDVEVSSLDGCDPLLFHIATINSHEMRD